MARSITQLSYTKEQGFSLTQRNQKTLHAELLTNSYLSPYLVILNFRIKANKQKKRTILILPDMVSKEEFRHLRIKLKYFH